MTVITELFLWLVVTTSLVGQSICVNRSDTLPLLAFLKNYEDNVPSDEKSGQINFFLTLPRPDPMLKGTSSGDDDIDVESKRQFDPWGGKRRHASYPAAGNDKRQFSPWGGKRGVIYAVGEDDMDQNPLLLSQKADSSKLHSNSSGGKRSGNSLRSKRSFNSLARKRSFNSWGGKRSFHSWGGKRGFNSWGGKRSFNSWGGKRSLDAGDRANSISWVGRLSYPMERNAMPSEEKYIDSLTAQHLAERNDEKFNSNSGDELDNNDDIQNIQ